MWCLQTWKYFRFMLVLILHFFCLYHRPTPPTCLKNIPQLCVTAWKKKLLFTIFHYSIPYAFTAFKEWDYAQGTDTSFIFTKILLSFKEFLKKKCPVLAIFSALSEKLAAQHRRWWWLLQQGRNKVKGEEERDTRKWDREEKH